MLSLNYWHDVCLRRDWYSHDNASTSYRIPDAKIGVLCRYDDFGKGYVKGFKDGLREKAASMIVAEASYELTDPTVDSQIVSLKASGADTLLNFATGKAATQAIRKIYDVGWKPLHISTRSQPQSAPS